MIAAVFSSPLPTTRIRPVARIFFPQKEAPTRAWTSGPQTHRYRRPPHRWSTSRRTGTHGGNRSRCPFPRHYHEGPGVPPHPRRTAAHVPELSLKRRSGALEKAMAADGGRRGAERSGPLGVQRDQRPPGRAPVSQSPPPVRG